MFNSITNQCCSFILCFLLIYLYIKEISSTNLGVLEDKVQIKSDNATRNGKTSIVNPKMFSNSSFCANSSQNCFNKMVVSTNKKKIRYKRQSRMDLYHSQTVLNIKVGFVIPHSLFHRRLFSKQALTSVSEIKEEFKIDTISKHYRVKISHIIESMAAPSSPRGKVFPLIS